MRVVGQADDGAHPAAEVRVELVGAHERRAGTGGVQHHDGGAHALGVAVRLEPGERLRREAGLVAQIANPIAKGKGTGARDRAEELVREIAALSVTLHTQLVKAAVKGALD